MEERTPSENESSSSRTLTSKEVSRNSRKRSYEDEDDERHKKLPRRR